MNTDASWKRINFDLHHSLGIFSAILLLIITSTGLWVNFGRVDDWMKQLNRTPTPPVPSQPGQHMIDIKRSLHTGDIYGLPTQILWMIGAFLLAAQAVSPSPTVESQS